MQQQSAFELAKQAFQQSSGSSLETTPEPSLPMEGGLLQPEGEETSAFDLAKRSLRETPEGFGEGFTSVFSEAWESGSWKEAIPFFGSAYTADKYATLWSAADRLERGTQTREDEDLLLAFLSESQKPSGIGRMVGDILLNLPGFAIEFWLSGGLLKLGTKGAASLAGKGLREAIEKTAQRGTLKAFSGQLAKRSASGAIKEGAIGVTRSVAGSAAQLGVMAGLQEAAGGSRIRGNAWRRAMPQMSLSEEDAGRLAITFHSTTGEFMDALPQAVLDELIEVYSERSGEALLAGASKIPGWAKVQAMMGAVAENWTKKHPGGIRSLLSTVSSKTGWHGPIGEFLEERFGGALRGATGVEEGGVIENTFPGLDQMAAELIAFSVPTAAGTGVQLATDVPAADYENRFADRAGEAKTLSGPLKKEEIEAGVADLSSREGVAFNVVEAPDKEAAKEAEAVAKARGADIVWVSSEDGSPLPFNAALLREGVIAMDANAAESPAQVVLEELFHDLREKDQALHDELAQAVRDIDKDSFEEYLEEYKALYKEVFGRELAEEAELTEGLGGYAQMHAGLLYLASTKNGREALAKLVQNKRSFVQRLVDWMKEVSGTLGLGLRTTQQKRLEALDRLLGVEGMTTVQSAEAALLLGDAFQTTVGVAPPTMRLGPGAPRSTTQLEEPQGSPETTEQQEGEESEEADGQTDPVPGTDEQPQEAPPEQEADAPASAPLSERQPKRAKKLAAQARERVRKEWAQYENVGVDAPALTFLIRDYLGEYAGDPPFDDPEELERNAVEEAELLGIAGTNFPEILAELAGPVSAGGSSLEEVALERADKAVRESGELYAVELDKDEHGELINKWHDKHHKTREKLNPRYQHALAVMAGDELLAVATLGTPTGRWAKEKQGKIVELQRVISSGSRKNASSLAAAQSIEWAKRNGLTLVTYSEIQEAGSTYKALQEPRKDGYHLRPTSLRPARQSRAGKPEPEKVRWEAGPLAGEAIELPGQPQKKSRSREEQEAEEIEIVSRAREEIGKGGTPQQIFRRLVALYKNQRRPKIRTSETVLRQQYSTPIPLAYLASQLAGVEAEDVVYEPTAGHGMLLVGVPGSALESAQLNEIDADRAARLEAYLEERFGPTEGGRPRVSVQDATEHTPNVTPTVVLANPPFGKVAGESRGKPKSWSVRIGSKTLKTTTIDHAIVAKSLETLKDGGRAVFIIGSQKSLASGKERRQQEREKAYRVGATGRFFNALYDNWNVVQHVTIDGELYKQQGAAWPVDIIVIEGRGASKLERPREEAPEVLYDWKEIEKLLVPGRGESASSQRAGERGGTAVDAGVPESAPTTGAGVSEEGEAGGGTGASQAPGGDGGSGRTGMGSGQPESGGSGSRARLQQPDGTGVPDGRSGVSGESSQAAEDAANPPGGLVGATNDDLARLLDETIEEAYGEDAAPSAVEPGESEEAIEQAKEQLSPEKMAQEPESPEKEEGSGRDEDLDSIADLFSLPRRNVDPGEMWRADILEGAQSYTSERTSRKQVPAGRRMIDWQPGTINADIGGGKYDDFTDWLRERGVINKVYDPYNRSHVHNRVIIRGIANGKADTATVFNVLNVIREADVRQLVIAQAADAIKPDGVAVFQVYDGGSAKSGKGAQATKDGWQEFRKAHTYRDEVASWFGEVEIKGSSLIAKEPRKLQSGRAVFSLPRRDERYRKIAKTFVSSLEKRGVDPNDAKGIVTTLVGYFRDELKFTKERMEKVKGTVMLFMRDVQNGVYVWGSAKQRDRVETNPNNQALETDLQVPYEGMSQGNSMDTLMPKNLMTSMLRALRSLREEHGDIDEWVAEEMGWTTEELHQYLGQEQIDALAMALNSFSKNSGFILGDQTGVGKGRVVAALIRWTIRQGHTPVFLTQSPGLYAAMFRDLHDIGEESVNPFITNTTLQGGPIKLPARPSQKDKGEKDGDRVLRPVSAKKLKEIADHARDNGQLPGPFNAVFSTYAQSQFVGGKARDRHTILENIAPTTVWILDESHEAGGQQLTPADEKKIEEGEKMPRAVWIRRVTAKAIGVGYSSATFAKNPWVLSLYHKTDLSLAIPQDDEMMKITSGAIATGGVPMQQFISTLFSKAGQMVRRERSFEGVEFSEQIVEVDKQTVEYVSETLRDIFSLDMREMSGARSAFVELLQREGLEVAGDTAVGDAGASDTVGFTSVMHNLVASAYLSLKAPEVADAAIAEWKAGRKPTIFVNSTLGAALRTLMDANDLSVGDTIEDPSFKNVMKSALHRLRTLPIKDGDGKKVDERYIRDQDFALIGMHHALEAWNKSMQLVEGMDFAEMTLSPIDVMRERMEEAGMSVGELSGRDVRVRTTGDGQYRIERQKTGNAAKQERIARFNDGSLDALIFNVAAATGYSFHAGAKFLDQRRRVMFIAQAAQDINVFMQALGRIHRTGQVTERQEKETPWSVVGTQFESEDYGLPIFRLMYADTPGEMRPRAMVSAKLQALNANVTASAKGAANIEGAPSYMNKYGDAAAMQVLQEMDLVDTVSMGFFQDSEGKIVNSLGMPVPATDLARKLTGKSYVLPLQKQQELYDRLISLYEEKIEQLNAIGANDLEAPLLELDAKRLQVLLAQEADGPSPFQGAVFEERLDVLKLNPPESYEDIMEKVEKSDSVELLREAEEELPRRLEEMEDSAGSASELLATLEKKIESLVQKIETMDLQRSIDGKKKKNKKSEEQKELESELRGLRSRLNELNVLENAAKRDSVRLSEAAVFLRELSRKVVAGRPVQLSIKVDSDSETSDVGITDDGGKNTLYGVITKVGRHGRTVSALSPSDYYFEVYTNKSSAPLKVSFAAIKHKTVELNTSTGPVVKGRIDLERSSGREEVSVLTGNLLRAWAQFEKSGTLAMFKDSEGRVRSGVMLRGGKSVVDLLSEAPLRVSLEQAEKLMDAAGGVVVFGEGTKNRPAGMAIRLQNGNVSIKLSNAKGVRWMLDRLEASGHSFVQRSEPGSPLGSTVWVSRQAGGFELSDAIKILSVLTDGGRNISVPDQLKAHSRKVLGVEIKAGEPKALDDPATYSLPRRITTVTESAAFKSWFRDSKVVDADGKPLAVYHGTDRAFTVFDRLAASRIYGGKPDMNAVGSWFSSSPDAARQYARRASVMPVFLSIKRPARLTFEQFIEDGQQFDFEWDEGKPDGAFDGGAVKDFYEREGFDGIIFDDLSIDGFSQEVYVAFRPEQIKSVTGNRGTFGPNDPDIRHSLPRRKRKGKIVKLNFDAGEESRIDWLRRKMQDKDLRWKRAQEEMDVAGAEINDDSDVYGAMELYPGRVESRVSDWERNRLEPITELMRESGIDINDLDLFLYARHAEERNNYIRQKNYDAWFQGELGRVVRSAKNDAARMQQLITEIREQARFATKEEKKELRARLREARAEMERFLGMANDPLPHMDAPPADLPFQKANDPGSGMRTKDAREYLASYLGGESGDAYRRLGEMVDEMNLETLESQVRSGLVSRDSADEWMERYQHYVPLRTAIEPGREAMGQRFDTRQTESREAWGRRSFAHSPLTFALQQSRRAIVRGEKNRIGLALLRLIKNNQEMLSGEFDVREEDLQEVEVGELIPRKPIPREGEFALKNRGKVVYVRVRDPLLLRSLEGSGVQHPGPVVRTFSSINRWLARMNTSLDPGFMLSNFVRDLQTAGINLSGEKGVSMSSNVVGATLSGAPVRAIFASERGKADPNNEWVQAYRELKDAGGTTGWFHMKPFDEELRDLENSLQSSTRDRVLEPLHRLGGFIEDAGKAVENGVRLAAFKYARDAGYSVSQSARLAKNLTVNFNRSGEWGTVMNSLYLFYNASIQGTLRMASAMRHPTTRRIVMGIAASGYLLDALNRSIGDDDDDGMPFYDKIPQWVKDRNLIVMLPGTGGDYLRIPLPYGYNIPHAAGQIVGAVRHGGMPISDAVSNMAQVAWESFYPLGSEASLAQTMSPTLFDPIVQIAENSTFYGAPIRPESYGSPDSPRSQRYWGSVNPTLKAVTEWLNELGGGDRVTPGRFFTDQSPEDLEHLIEFSFGGVGRQVKRTWDIAELAARREPIPTYKVPFIRRFYGESDDRMGRQQYYDQREVVQRAEKALKEYEKEPDKLREIRISKQKELSLVPVMRKAESRLRRLRRDKRAAEEAGQRERVRAIEEAMAKVQRAFSRRYRAVM